MKKSLLALAVLGAFAGAAHAQSSVTVYGVADVGIDVGSNGNGRIARVVSGQLEGSHLGFKGAEELTPGLRAIFDIEMGLSLDNGASGNNASTSSLSTSATGNNSGSLWDRQAWAGLSSTTLGTVTLGRQYVPAFYVVAMSDPTTLGLGMSPANLLSGVVARSDNSIAYQTPAIAGVPGLTVRAMYGSGDEINSTTADRASGKYRGVSATYGNGPITAGLGYGKTNISATAGGPGEQKDAVIGGTYDFGPAKLYASLGTVKRTTTGGAKLLDYNVKDIGVKAKAGSGFVVANFGVRNDKTTTNIRDNKVYGVAYLHPLSKRTILYAGVSKMSASPVVTGLPVNTAVMNNTAVAGSGLQGTKVDYSPKTLQLGMRHAF